MIRINHWFFLAPSSKIYALHQNEVMGMPAFLFPFRELGCLIVSVKNVSESEITWEHETKPQLIFDQRTKSYIQPKIYKQEFANRLLVFPSSDWLEHWNKPRFRTCNYVNINSFSIVLIFKSNGKINEIEIRNRVTHECTFINKQYQI